MNTPKFSLVVLSLVTLITGSTALRAQAPAAPRQATPAEALATLPEFKVELIRSAAPGEGSWVCITVDPKGRLIISPQDPKHPMLRVTLTPEGQIEKIQPIELQIGGAMGLLCAFDSLYVNGKGKDGLALYRLH